MILHIRFLLNLSTYLRTSSMREGERQNYSTNRNGGGAHSWCFCLYPAIHQSIHPSHQQPTDELYLALEIPPRILQKATYGLAWIIVHFLNNRGRVQNLGSCFLYPDASPCQWLLWTHMLTSLSYGIPELWKPMLTFICFYLHQCANPTHNPGITEGMAACGGLALNNCST